MPNYIFENFEVDGFQINEYKGEKKEGVLSKVVGPSFFLDGYSRNGRFYPAELWENALKNPETQRMLERGLMFGCIGHPTNYTLDELLESGKVSHKVVSIKIDKEKKQGIVEYEILDTPAGRILDAVLKSGSKLYVSTRAFGSFSDKEKIKEGKKYKVLDPNNFVLESIDFVIQPGFLETNPKLVESLKEDFKALKEDPYGIQCEDGICSLAEKLNDESIVKKEEKQTDNDEIKDKDQTKTEQNGKTEEVKAEQKEQTEQTETFEETLEKIDFDELSKEDLKGIIENILRENKFLSQNIKLEKEEDETVLDKRKFNFITYVELLTKLLKYNVDFEKYYDSLIEFLDKDDRITNSDIEKMLSIVEQILEESELDSSIEEVCEILLKIGEKIKGKGDNNESVISTIEYLIQNPVNRKELEEKESIINKKESIIQSLKQATLSLTEKIQKEKETIEQAQMLLKTTLEEKEQREKFLEDLLKEKNEKIHTLESNLKTLEEKLSSLQKEYDKKIEGIVSNILEERESMEESYESELKELRESLQHTIEENSNLLEIQGKLDEKLKEYEEKIDKLSSTLEKRSIKYFSLMYKLDEDRVKTLMESSSNEEELKTLLEKEQKLSRRTISEKITLPEYKKTEEKSVKSRFLESLIK